MCDRLGSYISPCVGINVQKVLDAFRFFLKDSHKQVGPAREEKKKMGEKSRGIGFETVAGMGGGEYRRNIF